VKGAVTRERSVDSVSSKGLKPDVDVPLVGIVVRDVAFRTALDSLIRSVGYRSAIFSSGTAFLDSTGKQEISCLILDLNMPGLNGFEVLHRLAKMNYLIPPTILFGDNDGELREEALRRGAVAVLQKACGNENLLAAVASALRLSTR